MFVVTGSPTQAFVDAIRARLVGDPTLMALVTAVTGHVTETARPVFPYLVIGYRHLDEGVVRSMGLAGGRVVVQLDGWSSTKGAFQMHAILSRARVLLERRDLNVSGFHLVKGSLTCEFEDVYDEPDEDAPEKKLYRGIQRWGAEIDEAA